MLVERKQTKNEAVMKRYLIIYVCLLAVVAAKAQDSLKTYIQAALLENPEVKARWLAYEAAMQAVCPAGTLGDPELSVNFYPSRWL